LSIVSLGKDPRELVLINAEKIPNGFENNEEGLMAGRWDTGTTTTAYNPKISMAI
jgi:hypothetical protein